MKKNILFLVLTLLLSSSLSAQRAATPKITPDLVQEMNQSRSADERFRVIIVMNEQLDALSTNQKTQYLNKEQQREVVVNDLMQLSKDGQSEIMKDLTQGQKANLVGDVQSFWIINAIGCSATKDMIFAISNRSDVKYVMKDMEIHAIDDEDAEPLRDQASNHWNIDMVNADDVWALGYTGAGVIVAVIDSGVNYDHNDIVNNMWDGGADYPHHGWDFVNNDNDPMDDQGHGTHCAGTVASTASSNVQYGIAKDAKIMALKVLSSTGSGYKRDSWTAIQFAISHGADILSMSLGADGKGGFYEERVIMEHVLQCGVVASVAAGNVGDKYTEGVLTYPVPNNVGAPGNCPPPWHNPAQTLEGGRSAVVCVGATTSNDEHSSFSSFGPVTWSEGNNIGFYYDYPWEDGCTTNIGLIRPDISAPGSSITSLSHNSNSGYTTKSGTSMATPCVAGVMALMLSVNPELTPTEIDSIIETTATPLGGQTSKNNITGAGRIDALAAVNYMLTACDAPTGLVADENHARVVLTWDAANNVNTYRVYRNDVVIANNVATLTYTDESAPAGNNTYYIRSNGTNNHASLPSNRVSVNVTTNLQANTPNSLTITAIDTDDNTMSLSWEAPQVRNGSLNYTNEGTNFYGTDEEAFVAAQNYPPSILQAYAGMEINSISFTVQNPNITCTVNIYEGDLLQPGTLIHSGTVTTTESGQTITYTLETPLVINPNQNLWITISLSDFLLVGGCNIAESNNGFLFRFESTNYWFSQPYHAWDFQMGLSDGVYTYNVYCNNTAISTGQSTTSYNGVFSGPMNTYHVTAVTNNYESPISNTVLLAQNTSIDDLSLTNDEQLVVASGSTLTVNETLNNPDPANLVIEDGAQLIHPNSEVKATLKKTINAFTTNKDGWYTIASPVDELGVSIATTGDYDLYAYDEKNMLWLNQENTANSITQFAEGQGFLYANAAIQSLSFAGDMRATDATVSVPLSYQSDNTSLKGFNLVGNPFTRSLQAGDIKIGNTPLSTYYVVEGGSELETRAIATAPIKPGQGFLVQASAEGQNLVFNPSSKDGSTEPGFISIKTDNHGFSDRIYVQIGEGNTLHKMSLNNATPRLSALIDNDEYASVTLEATTGAVPLMFRPDEDGLHTLTFELYNLQSDYLHLIDHIAGADIDLNAITSYSFEAKVTDYPSRFQLVFSEDANPHHYFYGHDFIDGKTQILDITGRVVATDCNTTLAPGIYLLRTINGKDIKTEKIIIK